MFSSRYLVLTAFTVWNSAIALYLVSLRAAGRSEGTVRLHRHYLSLLARNYKTPYLVTTDDLRSVLARVDWSPETRKSARGVYRKFYGWAHEAAYMPANPAARLEGVRVPSALPRPTPETIIAEAITSVAPRERLMIRLGAYGGLRAAEIAQVHSSDLEGDVLRVVGKGRKVRTVPIVSRDLMLDLQCIDGWAFPNGHGTHISPGHVTKLVSAAMPAGWTCHTLRHRMATVAYAGTRDLLAVGEALGHSRPETTKRYVRMPDDAVRAAMLAAA